MLNFCALVFSLISVSWSFEDLTFPPTFQFGVASSAYQIEGAWNASDKGESIWDRYTHTNQLFTATQVSGDVACDSYQLWMRDVEMLEELEVNFYRFSISWSRVLPNGFSNYISKEGTKYYSDLIDALLEKGIQPIVTLNHFDLPQGLQNLGGWANPLSSIWFANYARIVFSFYGDRVKTWITINEPLIACEATYQQGHFAPGIISSEGSLLCTKHILIAHAKAWRVYDEEFRAKYNGRVSIAFFQVWFQPLTKEDEDLAELSQQLTFGLYTHPIFSKEGGWPPVVEKLMADYSKKLGYPSSNLQPFSNEEIKLLKGSYDFFSLNYYTSRTVRRAKGSEDLDPRPAGAARPQVATKLEIDPSWKHSSIAFYPINPEGIRKQLNWIKKEYGDVSVIISENGVANDGGLQDKDRIQFIRNHLKQVLLAIKEDGINVTAFTVWSLMDSFEWMDRYRPKFGLYEVDFTSLDKKRTPRASAFYYSSIIRNRSLNVSENISVNVHAKHKPTASSSMETKSSSSGSRSTATRLSYILITGGVLLLVAILIALLIHQMRKRRVPVIKKGSYVGVQSEELDKRSY